MDNAAQNKEFYDRDLDSGAKSAARSKAYYHADINKGRADSAARSKDHYQHDIAASRTFKKQRYVVHHVCSLLIIVLSPGTL